MHKQQLEGHNYEIFMHNVIELWSSVGSLLNVLERTSEPQVVCWVC